MFFFFFNYSFDSEILKCALGKILDGAVNRHANPTHSASPYL